MLSTISNSEKKKVPDIHAIVTLLLLISHQTFIHISPGRYNVLLDTDIFFFYVFSYFYQYGLNTANANITARQILQVYYESHYVIMYVFRSPSIYILIFWFIKFYTFDLLKLLYFVFILLKACMYIFCI